MVADVVERRHLKEGRLILAPGFRPQPGSSTAATERGGAELLVSGAQGAER